MAILFSDNTPMGSKVYDLLHSVLRENDLRFYPEIGDSSEIEYAIIRNPKAGSLSDLPNLKAIFTLSAGVDSLIFDTTLPDVPIIRNVEPNLTRGMVEYAIYHTLRYHRHFHLYEKQQQQSLWKQIRQIKPMDRTVGVMGLGEMGLHCAQALRDLNFNVRGWSRSAKNIDGIKSFAGEAQFGEFLNGTDILFNVLPLTPETEGILNKDVFSKLPQGAFVINAGRGKHLVDQDLLDAMDSGHINAATLDVFHEEPLPEAHPFWKHENITITPHVASITDFVSTAENIQKLIKAFEKGDKLSNIVDRQRSY